MNENLNNLFKTYESKFKIVIENLKKYKENYEKVGGLAEKSQKEYQIMKEEIESKNKPNNAENLKYKKCLEENNQRMIEAREKQKSYENYIEIANKEREKYIELSEKTYDLAEKLDNEYI